MTRDPIAVLLDGLERPVQPRPEFADDLLARLEEELLRDTTTVQAVAPVRRVRRPRFVLGLAGVAAAAALVLAVVAVVVIALPGARTAAAALADARAAFAGLSDVRVVYTTRISADSRPGLEVAVTTEVLFADSTHWRSSTTAVSGRTSVRAGDFRVADGTYESTYTQDPPLLEVQRLSEVAGLVSASGLGSVSPDTVWAEGPREGVPPSTWFEQACDAREATYLDRPVALLTCDGDRLRVWLDDATGLVLRVTDVDSEVAVSALDLRPRFPEAAFTATAPPGAVTKWVGAPPVPDAYATRPSAGLRTVRLQGGSGWTLTAAEDGVWVLTPSRLERPFDMLVQRLGSDGTRGPVLRVTDQVDQLLVAEGRLWLAAGMDAQALGPSWVRPYDAVTGEQLGPRLEVEPQGASSASMAATPGVLWFTGGARSRQGVEENALARIDTSSGVVTSLGLGDDATAVATGFGSVWVALTDNAGDDPKVRVVRVDPTTNRQLASHHVPARATPARVVVGDRFVYVTSALGQYEMVLLAIDPRTDAVVAQRRISYGGIAYGAGQLWVTDGLRDRVHRLDPATLLSLQTVRVGRSPSQAVVAAGSLWVLNGADATVTVVPLG